MGYLAFSALRVYALLSQNLYLATIVWVLAIVPCVISAVNTSRNLSDLHAN